jgi:hypothetical protein
MALGDGIFRQKILDAANEYDTKLHAFVDRLQLSPEDQALFDAADNSFHKILGIIEEGAGAKIFERIRDRIKQWRDARDARRGGG